MAYGYGMDAQSQDHLSRLGPRELWLPRRSGGMYKSTNISRGRRLRHDSCSRWRTVVFQQLVRESNFQCFLSERSATAFVRCVDLISGYEMAKKQVARGCEVHKFEFQSRLEASPRFGLPNPHHWIFRRSSFQFIIEAFHSELFLTEK